MADRNQPSRTEAPDRGHRLHRRFLRGDLDATAHVAAVARRVVHDRGYYVPPGDREDIVQDVLLHAYRAAGRPGFVPETGFDAFVRSIAYRRVVDWMRRQRPTTALDPGTAGEFEPPDKQLLDREKIDLGRRVLSRLSESCRELIALRGREGLSYKEIAERQQRTEAAVRNQISRCFKKARRILEQIEGRAKAATVERESER